SPLHLIHLFSHSPENSDQHLEQFHQSMAMNKELLLAFEDEVKPLKRSFMQMKTFIIDIENRLTDLEDFIKKHCIIFTGVNQSLNLQENKNSHQLLREFKVENVEDVDHE
ncbi:hypothetical protein HK096_003979, partial [Nowakowskiella sp. JEL0078]